MFGILDSYCEVFAPLPDEVWANLDTIPFDEWPHREYGPRVQITGTGFFEFFLPLATILGDIIDIHHRRHHPRLGGQDDSQAVAAVNQLLADCQESVAALEHRMDPESHLDGHDLVTSPQFQDTPSDTSSNKRKKKFTRLQLVVAYSSHILHVLHVLLHGKWDAISMMDDDDDWITSAQFMACASHAVAASQAVSNILSIDPELTFMPYLFGIYLLQGSFVLLLFAERMPQVGSNESVEQACETIIRAHEVCVVTLSTEFQVSPHSFLGQVQSVLATKHYILNYLVEELPQSPPIDSILRTRRQPDPAGRTESPKNGTVILSLDKRCEGLRVVMNEEFSGGEEL